MNEFRENRLERIEDIRFRKGHLLGATMAETLSDRRKFSVMVSESHFDGMVTECDADVPLDKGTPETMQRSLSPTISEFVKPAPEDTQRVAMQASGQVALGSAIERQQGLLAEIVHSKQVTAEAARTKRLDHYIELLQNPLELSDQDTADIFFGYAKEFYLPRGYEEDGRIIDAGGITYGA